MGQDISGVFIGLCIVGFMLWLSIKADKDERAAGGGGKQNRRDSSNKGNPNSMFDNPILDELRESNQRDSWK